MRFIRSLRLTLLLIACRLAAPQVGHALNLSGTVVDSSGHPLAGVEVSLEEGPIGNAAFSDVNGKWILRGSGSGLTAKPRSSATDVANRLVLESDRLHPEFQGASVAGRFQSEKGKERALPLRKRAQGDAARMASVIDSVVLTPRCGVRVLLPITSDTGDLGTVVLDTNWNPWNPSITYGSFTDSRDGQAYRTVKIGKQTWMAQNLNYKVDSSWNFRDSPDSGARYGRLYTWASALGLPNSCNHFVCAPKVSAKPKGICPTGWHVPSDAEWTTLLATAGNGFSLGHKLKSASAWLPTFKMVSGVSKSTNSVTPVRAPGNDFGFTALPASFRDGPGYFGSARSSADYWTSTELDSASVQDYSFTDRDSFVRSSSSVKSLGFSLRCIAD